MSSEQRDLLIRQIADELGPHPTFEFGIETVLAALDRLGFEVIPASTLEADRRVVEAADALIDAVTSRTLTGLADAVRARRGGV